MQLHRAFEFHRIIVKLVQFCALTSYAKTSAIEVKKIRICAITSRVEILSNQSEIHSSPRTSIARHRTLNHHRFGENSAGGKHVQETQQTIQNV